MKYSHALTAVCALASIVFVIRLWLSLSTPYFADDPSYYTLRQLDYMIENGEPFTYDSLAFSGRQVIVQPYWYLLLPLAQISSPAIAIKVFTNLVAATLIPIIFLFCYLMTKSIAGSFFGSLSITLSPIFTTQTINSGDPLGLVLLLVILSLYFLLQSSISTRQNSKWLYFVAALLCYSIGVILHISAAILLIGLILFMILNRTEKINAPKMYEQFWITCTILTIWIFFIVYKNAVILHGAAIFYENIPFQLRADNFIENNIFIIIGTIGVIPLLAATYAFFTTLQGRQVRGVFILSSLGLAALVLGLLTFIPIAVAATYVAVTASILVAPAYTYLMQFFEKTRVKINPAYVIASILFVVLLTLGGPAAATALQRTTFVQHPDEQLVEFLQETEDESLIIWEPQYGDYLIYRTNKRVAMTTNFLFIENPDELYGGLQTISSSILTNDVLTVASRYGVQKYVPGYIVTTAPLRAAPSECLEPVYHDNGYFVYKTACELIQSA